MFAIKIYQQNTPEYRISYNIYRTCDAFVKFVCAQCIIIWVLAYFPGAVLIRVPSALRTAYYALSVHDTVHSIVQIFPIYDTFDPYIVTIFFTLSPFLLV